MWTMKWSGEHPHCFCVIYLAELCLSEPHKKDTEQLPGPCVVDANIINFLLPLPLVTGWGCKFSRMISVYKEP